MSILLLALTCVLGAVTLLVVLFFAWAAYATRPPPGNDGKLYLPPRVPGVINIFHQHLNLLYDEEKGDYQWLLENAAKCEEKGLDGFFMMITLFGRRMCPVHPKDAHHILITNASNFLKDEDPYKKIEFILGRYNLVTLRDETVHALHRRLVQPAFSPRMLQVVAETFVTKYVNEFAQGVEREFFGSSSSSSSSSDYPQNHDSSSSSSSPSQGSVALHSLFHNLALNVVTEAAFSAKNYSGTDINKEFDTLTRRGLGNFKYVFFPLWMRNLAVTLVPKFRQVFGETSNSINKIRTAAIELAHKAKERSMEPGSEHAFIECFVQEKSLTDEMIADHAVTTMQAGSETTSTALTFCAYLLAQHQDKQQKLFEELQDHIPQLHTVPQLDDVKELPYLDAFIKEQMRLHPPVPSIVRRAQKDDTLPSGLKVAAGDFVIVSPLIHHRHKPTWGEDADVFRPERWLEDPSGRGGAKGTYQTHWYPFLIGRRYCIGKNFALNEMYVALATFARRWKVEFAPGARFPLGQHAVTLRPYPMQKLILTRRPH